MNKLAIVKKKKKLIEKPKQNLDKKRIVVCFTTTLLKL